jgi:hypothetical protein
MKIRGVSEIRGVRSLNTRPGPITESSGLLKLHQLAAEKENLIKKLDWIQGQKNQTEKRLAEIGRAMDVVEQAVEQRAKREPVSTSPVCFHGTSIKY